MKTLVEYLNFLDEANGNAEYNNASVGEICEGLFAAALTASYLKKGKKVLEKDMLRVLKKTMSNSPHVSNYKVADDSYEDTYDKVICRIKVPELADAVLKKIDKYKDKDLLALNIKNILIFANTDRRTQLQSRNFANNGFEDSIEIDGDGVSNQKSTKIDVAVKFNGKISRGSVSLKAASTRVGQFDRGPVFDFDTHVGQLYKLLLKLPVPKLKRQYDHIIKTNRDAQLNGIFKNRDDPKLFAAKESVREGISMVSQQIVKDMDKALKGKSYKKKLVQMIQNAATRNDRTLSILDVTSLKRLRFGNRFVENISEQKFSAKVLEGTRGGPDKVVISVNSEPVLQIRPVIQANVKKTGKYSPRVVWYIEIKPAIQKYATSKN